MSNIRVVQYNVLAPNLCDEETFHNSVGFCDHDVRFKNICKILEEEIEKNSIICLQEVSRLSAGMYTVFFHQRGYTMIFASHSGPFTDFMGQAIAFPNDYELLECAYVSPYCKKFTWPKKREKMKGYIPIGVVSLLSLVGMLSSSDQNKHKIAQYGFSVLAATSILFHFHNSTKPKGKFDCGTDLRISVNAREKDCIPMLKLKTEGVAAPFWIATIHMPCKWWNGPLMSSFAAVAAQAVQEKAGNEPYVFAGDFNVAPDSEQYQLLSQGCINKCDIEIEGWRPEIKSMRSAYMVKNGTEPKYTNFVNTTRSGEFARTLDYIWLSQHWDVVEVDEVATVAEGTISWPSATQGSDHCKIGATLKHLNSLKQEIQFIEGYAQENQDDAKGNLI